MIFGHPKDHDEITDQNTKKTKNMMKIGIDLGNMKMTNGTGLVNMIPEEDQEVVKREVQSTGRIEKIKGDIEDLALEKEKGQLQEKREDRAVKRRNDQLVEKGRDLLVEREEGVDLQEDPGDPEVKKEIPEDTPKNLIGLVIRWHN